MKPSEPSLHFQAHVQFFRKVIVVGLGKTYSIPKCHLQRAQLSQKKNFFFFFLSSFSFAKELFIVCNCDSLGSKLEIVLPNIF